MNRRQLGALGLGLTAGGAALQLADENNTGVDDQLGKAMTLGGGALSQAANSGGTSESKNAKAADALDAVGDALKAYAAELRGD